MINTSFYVGRFMFYGLRFSITVKREKQNIFNNIRNYSVLGVHESRFDFSSQALTYKNINYKSGFDL